MKFSSLSVKRRPAKKGVLRTLFANVPRKKVRAATAAPPMPEVEGDVPNLGIARALVVILIIHVVAIAGIFAHSHWIEDKGPDPELAANQAAIVPSKPLPDADVKLPKVSDGDSTYITTAGDTYDKIARAAGVTEQELRAANGNMELRGGRVLKLPPRSIIAEVPPELERLRGVVLEETPVEDGDTSVAANTTTQRQSADELRNAPFVETQAAGKSAPQLIRPNVRLEEAATTGSHAEASAPKAKAVESTPAATKKYTVKSGDTFWRIAQAHKTTPAAIMKANRISDAKKLKVGMELMVP